MGSEKSRGSITIVSPSLEEGGVERYLRTLVGGLIERGITVTVFLPKASPLGSLRTDLARRGARVRSMEFRWRQPTSKIAVAGQILRDLWCGLASTRHGGGSPLMLMLPHPEFSPGLILGMALSRRRMTAVVHLVPALLSVTKARRRLYRLSRALGVRWVCVSQHNADVLAAGFGWPPDQIITIYNGVPTLPWPTDAARAAAAEAVRTKLDLPADARMLLSVGRLNVQKAHDIIVDSMPEVLRQVPTAYWVWAGDGPERAALQSRAAALGVEARLRLLGRQESVNELMLASDLLVFPSRYEGFALTPLEAQMLALPVIVSDAGSLAFAVRDGVDGAVVPVDDSAALAQETIDALTLADRSRERASIAARRVRSRFSSERMVEQTCRVAMGET